MYQMSSLGSLPDIMHGISSKSDGNMSFMWGEKDEVLQNREKFLDAIDVSPEDCVSMLVQHGTEIAVVDLNHRGRGMFTDNAIETDGFITNTPGLYLFLLTADCLPILFYDPTKKVIALIHAGWKSTHGKIVEKVINKFIKEYHSNAADIFVGIGPGIHKESYIFPASIEKRVPTGFKQKFLSDWGNFIVRLPNNSFSLDIIGYSKQQLMESGISEEHIEISPIDTTKSPDFFSHYRCSRTGEKEGRFATVFGMK